MRASVSGAWRIAAAVAFAATAALAVALTRTPLHAALTSNRNTPSTKNIISGGSHARPGLPQCGTSRLDISIALENTSVAGGNASRRMANLAAIGFPLDFTNVSTTACILSGYPEVAAYSAGGAQVGNAAGLDTTVSALRIVLAPGATAHAAVVDSASARHCRLVPVTGLRVILPGQSVPRFVRHTIPACSAAGRKAPVFLHVRAVQPGTGVAGGSRAHPRSASREHARRSPRPAANAAARPTAPPA
jgi:hypothetical protein